MALWTCPECDRTFGRARQGHLCIPATTVNEWFADEPYAGVIARPNCETPSADGDACSLDSVTA